MFIAGAILEGIFHAGEEQGLDPAGWQPDRVGALILSFLAIAVAAPLAEELTFRGLGYYLLSQFGAWAAIVITALTFALAHGLIVGIPVFFVIYFVVLHPWWTVAIVVAALALGAVRHRIASR